MLKSEIIFWGTIFVFASLFVLVSFGAEAMFWSWLLWLIMYLIFWSGFLYYKMLQKRFDK